MAQIDPYRTRYKLRLKVIDYKVVEEMTVFTEYSLPGYFGGPLVLSNVIQEMEQGNFVEFEINDKLSKVPGSHSPVIMQLNEIQIAQETNFLDVDITGYVVLIDGFVYRPDQTGDVYDNILAAGLQIDGCRTKINDKPGQLYDIFASEGE